MSRRDLERLRPSSGEGAPGAASLRDRLRRWKWSSPLARAALALSAIVGFALIGSLAAPRTAKTASAMEAMAAASATPVDVGAPAASASSTPPEPSTPSEPPPNAAILPDGRIVLNLATEDDLTKLPHVGPTRAKAILALRQRLGKFHAVTDLLRVKGLGRKTLAKLAPKVVVDPPKDAPPPS